MASSGEVALLKGRPRAQRFPVVIPMRFRVRGEPGWRTGHIENISSSGVLFRSSHLLEPQTTVDLQFVLPVTIPGGGGQVVCHGIVVRAVVATGTMVLPVLATRILNYRFGRP